MIVVVVVTSKVFIHRKLVHNLSKLYKQTYQIIIKLFPTRKLTGPSK